MTVETPPSRPGHTAASGAAPERRAEALVAAYIHELSPRHRAKRESVSPEPDRGELRT